MQVIAIWSSRRSYKSWGWMNDWNLSYQIYNEKFYDACQDFLNEIFFIIGGEFSVVPW